ncbi:IclR family transcriptional regulator [Pleomorphomonas sp. NRK KF1]|uniref:IclR family transcriptional regulator n=1 Tax=Pleomorphomonas sp. NRK KF1 TaxID=2943000 RepID=UPI0020446380|nr:IclR family transcriptional regulator [Pleomorphomonas sp. NRK KF1]MCM5552821.1 IclR family transcriptional regulator [Pleomorphomonas sp. NRK KF1]
MPLIQAVERALNILDLFSEQKVELNLAEISQMTGMHKSTLHSLLKTLQSQGYIEQTEANAPYRLGVKLLERGYLVQRSRDFIAVARPYLESLSERTGQTIHLGVLDGKSGVYVDKVEGTRSIIVYSRIGRRMPIHTTAIGKVLLAFQSPSIIGKTLDGYDFASSTENTITQRDMYEAALAKVRSDGFAVDEQENVRGCRCAAVPVWGHDRKLVAAISISTVVENVSMDEFKSFIEQLKVTGASVSHDLGY